MNFYKPKWDNDMEYYQPSWAKKETWCSHSNDYRLEEVTKPRRRFEFATSLTDYWLGSNLNQADVEVDSKELELVVAATEEVEPLQIADVRVLHNQGYALSLASRG